MAEVGDRTRVETPRQVMTYLGLLPAEPSSGEGRRQGAITKAGTTPARAALVEGAWAYRDPANVSQDLSWKAQGRRCQR